MEPFEDSTQLPFARDAMSLSNAEPQQFHYPLYIEFQMTDGGVKTIKRTEKNLGKGGQGYVFLGIDEEDKEYAIKIFDLLKYKRTAREHYKKDFEQELNLLRSVNSPYVVKLYGQASS